MCYEVIFIDDCSNDKCNEILKKFIKLFNKKNIRIISYKQRKNRGPSEARNKAWSLSTGDYIAFLDADDTWEPKKLEICVNWLNELKPIQLIHQSAKEINLRKFEKKKCASHQDYSAKKIWPCLWLLKNYGCTPSIIIKRDISERFDEKMKYCEDYDLWLRVAFKYNNTYKIYGPPLSKIKIRNKGNLSLSKNSFQMRLGEIYTLWKYSRSTGFYLVTFPLFLTYCCLKYLLFHLRNIFLVKM